MSRGKKISYDTVELMVSMSCAGFSKGYIARKLGLNWGVVDSYLHSGSANTRLEVSAKRAGFETTRNYLEALVQRRGYENYAHYSRELRRQRKRFCFVAGFSE